MSCCIFVLFIIRLGDIFHLRSGYLYECHIRDRMRGSNIDFSLSLNFFLLYFQFWMVVFPEGTRYNPNLPEVIAKSREYARNHGIKYEQNI